MQRQSKSTDTSITSHNLKSRKGIALPSVAAGNMPQAKENSFSSNPGGQAVMQRAVPATQAGTLFIQGPGLTEQGKISKDEFLARLKQSLNAMADAALAPLGQSSASCPYILYWFKKYESLEPGLVERSLKLYAPDVALAGSWQQCIELVTQKAQLAFTAHVATGSLEGVPDELEADTEPPTREKEAEQAQSVGEVFQMCGSKTTDKEGDDENTASIIAKNANHLADLYKQGKYDDIAALLYQQEAQFIKKGFKNAKEYAIEYLSGCTAAAAAITKYICGRDLSADKGKKRLLSSAPENAFESGNGVYHLTSTGGKSHELTIVKKDESYDLYESDFNLPEGEKLHVLKNLEEENRQNAKKKEEEKKEEKVQEKNQNQSGSNLNLVTLKQRLVLVDERCGNANFDYAFQAF